MSVELRDNLEERKGQLIIDTLPSLPVNPNLIRSLFYNLIHNSIKYSKKEVPAVIKVYEQQKKLEDETNNADSYRIVIEDNGIGFEQKYAEQLFDIFKRLHIRSEFEGTGIGLALCKKIVEKHHGSISAEGKPAEGSQFIVSLPVMNNYVWKRS